MIEETALEQIEIKPKLFLNNLLGRGNCCGGG